MTPRDQKQELTRLLRAIKEIRRVNTCELAGELHLDRYMLNPAEKEHIANVVELAHEFSHAIAEIPKNTTTGRDQ